MEDTRYSAGTSPCPVMEGPQLYDTNEYKKMAANLKVKGSLSLFGDEYGDLSEFNTSEISLNLNNLIDDSHFNDAQFSEGLIQELQSLNVDKSLAASPVLPQGPRGLCAQGNPANNMHPNMYGNMYGVAQQNHYVKEEPHEQHEYSRLGYSNTYAPTMQPQYNPMTPVPPVDGLKGAPLKSPGKKNVAPGTEEYRRRRERNNIAVRKSREKAKARSRDTEERVKLLSRENDKLSKKCELLSKEVTVLHTVFSQYLPEHIHREMSKQLEGFQQQHQHLMSM